MKTAELAGAALDQAVAKARGLVQGQVSIDACKQGFYSPSSEWGQGGPIEREGIDVKKGNPLYFPKGNERGDYYEPLWIAGKMHGPTPLIAAMRCYVASKLGDEVEVPEGLL